MVKPVGLVIKSLSKEKNLNVSKLATLLGKSRQYVYNSFAKESMDTWELNEWATALKVDTNDLINRTSVAISKSFGDNSIGDQLLAEIKKILEKEVEMKNEELREKNQELREKNEQIRALQKALHDAQKMTQDLLGKSEGVSESADLGAIFFVNGKQIGLHPGVKCALQPL